MPRKLPVTVAALCLALPVFAGAVEDKPVELIPTVNLVPVNYRHRLVQQLSLAEDNQPSLLKAINDVQPAHREAMAYLLVNMSEADLKAIKGDYLTKNVELAYQARSATPWATAVPEEIFFRDVLPYANTDERRDDWRQDFYDRFMPLVKDCKTASDAVAVLNKEAFKQMDVKYHATKRKRPIQSPYESKEIHYASCTGLSIMLVDACRAVGIPARMAGTPMWFDNSGNHTWTEVWDKQWHFVGSAEPGKLDQTWFVDNAAKADNTKPEHAIYAISSKVTDIPYYLVLKEEDQSGIFAEDVTAFYVGRKTLTVKAPPDVVVYVRHNGNLIAAAPVADATFSLGAGQDYTVELIDSTGKVSKSKPVKLSKDADSSVEF